MWIFLILNWLLYSFLEALRMQEGVQFFFFLLKIKEEARGKMEPSSGKDTSRIDGNQKGYGGGGLAKLVQCL